MERKEFMDKFGDKEVMFSNYYKYCFTYTCVLSDDSTLSVTFGGDSDDIYRSEVCNNDTCKAIALDPYCGSVYKDGKEVCSFYDY